MSFIAYGVFYAVPHMNLVCFALHFNESSLRTQGPIRRGLSFWRWSRGLFSLFRPGVMGPCVRRDDPLRELVRGDAPSTRGANGPFPCTRLHCPSATAICAAPAADTSRRPA